ncbi:hypothetical protein Q763_01510 [Flavobacterium beibuense F44-8]|uniref:Uncharacterized protein n=1 Tax=Flavobacterium beibuense F44-8 TaxID=1406840 RepID=A0A0A2LYL2_9FLAO|nr:hypothetical protein [Flavobacterium beibuense]KGO84446.1 hypothetical protein Q763_01510 [Flavobacterium beibuense F44-8]
MNTQEIELQQLPFSVNKKKLTALYVASGMTERQIRDGINTIIADNRKLPSDKPVNVQNIWNCEFMEFVETYGLPKGYKK